MLDVLRPWLVRLEEGMTQSLLSRQEQESLYLEFLMEAQWRADIKTRYEAYARGKLNGWLSANDIRELENMNPLPEGGDDFWMPVNVQVVGAPPPPVPSPVLLPGPAA